jgi:hypothetical protein
MLLARVSQALPDAKNKFALLAAEDCSQPRTRPGNEQNNATLGVASDAHLGTQP